MNAPAPTPHPIPPIPEPELPTDPIVDWLEDHIDLLPELPALLLGTVTRYGPAVIAAALTAVALFTAGRAVVRHWRNLRHTQGAHLIEVAVPPQVEADSAAAWWQHQAGQLTSWWKRLIYGQPHLGFEYVADEGGIRFQIWVPGTIVPGQIERAVQASWPGATLTTRPADPPIPVETAATGGRMALGNTEHLPLRHDHDSDPLRALLGAMSGLRTGQYAAVQILARPCTGRRLNRAYRAAAHLRGGHSTAPQAAFFDLVTPGGNHHDDHPTSGEIAQLYPERAGRFRAMLAKAAQPRFEVQITYAAASRLTHLGETPGVRGHVAVLRTQRKARGRLRPHAHEIAATFARYGSGHQHLRRRRLHAPAHRMASRHLGRGYLLAVDELAALAHLPHDLDAPGVTRAGARPALPSPAVPTGGKPGEAVRILGDSDAGTSRRVGLTVAGARQHLHVLGQTGTGKSTFLANQILADARAGRGALVIDPKGDLIADVLDRLPERAIGKTVVFDPAQDGPPPCINVLAGPDPDFAVEAIVTTFRRCFSANWGARMDDALRSACMTLVKANGPRANLAEVPKLFNDAAFRARMAAKVQHDDVLRDFWKEYNDQSSGGRAAQVGPIMNKLRAVLLRSFVRDALSGSTSTVNLQEVFNSGGLVLVRAAKGILGEDAARLFGSLLLAQTWQAITPRTNLPEHARRDTTAYVDEAHNFLNLPGSISDILAEARAYRFSLVLAHQHLSQLPKDLRDAVSADARNKIYFAVSPEDAHALQQHTAPLIKPHDLAHLGAFQAAARIVHGSATTSAFTFRTRPLPELIPGRAEAIREASREKFTPADEEEQMPSIRPRALTEPTPGELDEDKGEDF